MLNSYEANIEQEVYKSKLAKQQIAIMAQIRKYKSLYLNRQVFGQNVVLFTGLSRQISFLVSSYLANMILTSQKVAGIVDDFILIFDDMIGKFQKLCLKYNQIQTKIIRLQMKNTSESALCASCNQQIKKTDINRLRKSILDEKDIITDGDREDQQQKNQEQDLKFFQQINDLLNMEHGHILKNQISIARYEQEALLALKSIQSIKDMFPQKKLVSPDTNWITAAQEDMQTQLKVNFNCKIPPWIRKMYCLFWNQYRKQIANRQIDEGVQTAQSNNLDILQMKKKFFLYKQHLDKTQQIVRSLEGQIQTKIWENNNLQTRIQDYRNKVNSLEDQMQKIKTQNQIIKLKMSRKALQNPISQIYKNLNTSQNKNHIDFERGKKSQKQGTSYQVQQNKIQKDVSNLDNFFTRSTQSKRKRLPNIIKNNLKGTKEKPQSQVSIKTSCSKSNHKSLAQSPNHSVIRNLRNSQMSSLDNQKQNKLMNQKYERTHNNHQTVRFKQNLIEQSQSQTEQNRKRIQQVSRQMKKAIVNRQHKRILMQKYNNSSILNAKFKDQLKKIPRITCKVSNTSVHDQNQQNMIQANKTQTNQNKMGIKKQIDNIISDLYAQLKLSGLLLPKVSEQDFKAAIDPTQTKSSIAIALGQSLKKYQDFKLSSVKKRNQKRIKDTKEWYKNNYINQDQYSSQQNKKYIQLFKNQKNAYNYQSSLTKNHQKGSYRLNQQQLKICHQFFQLIDQIKHKDFNHYKFICSYIRYPYQIMQNDWSALNLVNQMSQANFKQYFQRIVAIHQNCYKFQQGVCKHMKLIKIKLTKEEGI